MADKDNGGFPGHDEGTNRPPNVSGNVYVSSGSTFAPLAGGVDGGTTQKNSLGTSGKADGQE